MREHGQALDTLRWGDNIPVQMTGSAAIVGISSASSQKQILKAQWRWPLMWGLRIIVTVQSSDPGSPAFDVTYQVTIGSGQNSSTCTFGPYAVTPTAVGVYPVVTDFQELPACDVQVTASVVSSKALSVGSTSTIYLGAFVAPTTEPHAMTELLDHVTHDPEGKRWMQNYGPPSPNNPGTGIAFPIEPDPLTYQRR